MLSESVASALELAKQVDDKTVETRTFIRMFDRFFDIMNIKNLLQGKLDRKDTMVPFKNKMIGDSRFLFIIYLSQWSKETFLSYFDERQAEIAKIPNTEKKVKKMCISDQTLEGVRITGMLPVSSFIL